MSVQPYIIDIMCRGLACETMSVPTVVPAYDVCTTKGFLSGVIAYSFSRRHRSFAIIPSM